MYTFLIRPLLFRLDPERVHDLTLQALRFTGRFSVLEKIIRRQFAARSQKDASVNAFGLKFPNPVGLAAGYDKDGLAWRGLAALGFGHIEIGTITPRPQAGSPKPRVFRIPEEGAVINRMGFPGRGADFIAVSLRGAQRHGDLPLTGEIAPSSLMTRNDVILGVNIGKNKDTPNEAAAQDYVYLLERFSPFADYFAVNVSSPNTVGLRRLQARDHLEDLLSQLVQARLRSPVCRPILVKLAPDLADAELDDALGAIMDTGMDGVIATNTTVSRENLKSAVRKEAGGLSGSPLTARSRTMVAEIYRRTDGKLPIVGVGGIMTPDDAKAMLDVGATLIQVYTGLIYAGPGLVKEIIESL